MREFEAEKVLNEMIENTPVGQTLTLDFGGGPNIIDIEIEFKGGWVIFDTVIPGKPFVFTKGENGYLTGINITITPYDGIKSA
ncbi:MAG: hypothetical protein CENE_03281 [Candidatus Celerinatantimonas neptuna]|nr:MAG: hypothetical protein CENE_03281 [Candidatus Celerinatantimonas neptuna]